MDKERFNKLITDYSKIDTHFNVLEDLVGRYPYSQPVRMLNIKSSTTLEKKEYQKRLALAAFYSTDRTVLRSLIEKGLVPSDIDIKQPVPAKKAGTPVRSKIKARPKPSKDINLLREEVLNNLEELQKTKSWFLKQIGESIESKPKRSKVKLSASVPKTAQSKKTTTKDKPAAKRLSGSTVKTNKNELIDKFIATRPSITPGNEMKSDQSDLSKSSSELREDLVSENLAVIFAKQGKTDKAIEIYKRLIWKFPQKKASFAARIEELKKE